MDYIIFLIWVIRSEKCLSSISGHTILNACLGLLYFILCEKIASASIGKAIMKLEVKSRNGANISWLQAIVRNLSKIYWIPIIFDWLIGRFLKTDRILNNITRTTVVNAW